MKFKIIAPAIAGVAAIVSAFIFLRPTPLPEIPQSKRCAVMADRRDSGAIKLPIGASKDDVRRLLGDPQNTDNGGEVWVWLFDWESYERSGLPRDWLTMSQNSGGHDGLWIGFDAQGRIRTPLWSFSAATPPSRDHNR